MTENEAIERIKYRMHTAKHVAGEGGMEDLEMAIKALEEIQQYRATGTVEEYNPKNEKTWRPDWCPLRELPEKIPELKSGYEEISKSIYRDGWNACLDEILGGKDDGTTV